MSKAEELFRQWAEAVKADGKKQTFATKLAEHLATLGEDVNQSLIHQIGKVSKILVAESWTREQFGENIGSSALGSDAIDESQWVDFLDFANEEAIIFLDPAQSLWADFRQDAE